MEKTECFVTEELGIEISGPAGEAADQVYPVAVFVPWVCGNCIGNHHLQPVLFNIKLNHAILQSVNMRNSKQRLNVSFFDYS